MTAYGQIYNGDSLGNLEVGKVGILRRVALRFRSRGGVLNQTVVFYVFTSSPGYFGGTGGSVRVDLCPDDGSGAPDTGTVLATSTLTSMLSLNFRTINWSVPPTTTPGGIYYLVHTNVDADPATNYVSVDDVVTDAVMSPRQPTIPDADLAVLLSDNNGAWEIATLHTPIFRCTYADSGVDGQTYRDVRSGSGLNLLGGANEVRELFTVSGGDRLVDVCNARFYKQVGTVAPVIGTLRDNSGSIIEQVSVAASNVTTGESGAIWVPFRFGSYRTLTNGATYSFDLSSTDSANPYKIFPLQSGTTTALGTCPTQFDDGRAQFSTDTGGSWTNGANGLVQTDFDWQLYFNVVTAVQALQPSRPIAARFF